MEKMAPEMAPMLAPRKNPVSFACPTIAPVMAPIKDPTAIHDAGLKDLVNTNMTTTKCVTGRK